METGLRVLSYNVRYEGLDDGVRSWERRCDGVIGVCRLHRPDVMGFQECWLDQQATLEAGLPDYAFVGEETAGGDHTPIAYRRSRFECQEWAVFALSETPAELGSVGWDASYPRFATWARLTDRVTERTLLVANTHFDHEGPRARRESAILLRDRLPTAEADGLVVLGDFNCRPASDAYAALTAADPPPELSDARDAATTVHGPAETYVGFEEDTNRKRIDYVFVSSGVSARQFAVLADVNQNWRHPSDHLPVLADLSLPEA